MKKFRKINLISLLVLFLIIMSFKSYAVPYPEQIKWTAPPIEFVKSLYKGVLNRIQPDQNMLNDLAARINSKPQSRLDLFWLFINSTDYKASMYANQKKEYQVYYKYVTSGNMTKHSYYFATFPSGADLSLSGSYTYGIASAVRDYHATFDPKSIEYYGQSNTLTNDNVNGTVTDRAGRIYKTVKIGNQVWMAENLAYEIPGKQITDQTRWSDRNAAADGWCYYNNDKTTYGNTYGILYMWEAAKMACPAGWHLPSTAEWERLVNYLIANGYNYDGTTTGDKTAQALAAKTNWAYSSSVGRVGNNLANNNSSGFSALPGGALYDIGMESAGISTKGTWWTSTIGDEYSGTTWPEYVYIFNVNYDLKFGKTWIKQGSSVRCVKD